MTFAELIELVREWQSTMTPEQARQAIKDWAHGVTVTLGELRRRAPHSINWGPLMAAGVVEMLDDFEAATGRSSSRN